MTQERLIGFPSQKFFAWFFFTELHSFEGDFLVGLDTNDASPWETFYKIKIGLTAY
jgi:hypothetical protein